MFEKKKIYTALCILLLTPLATVFGIYSSGLLFAYHLTKRGVQTEGKIISKEAENHKSVTFEYEVVGRKFKSQGHVENIGKTFDGVKINDKITVYYDPVEPEKVTLRPPDERLQSSLQETLVFSFIPTLICFAYLIKEMLFSKTD